MEDEQSFSDICGGRLALQRRYYSSSCREFCLSCPRLSLRSLTAVTCTVWLAAYGLFTLCEVMAGRPLPAVRVGGWGLEGLLGSYGRARTSSCWVGGRELAGSAAGQLFSSRLVKFLHLYFIPVMGDALRFHPAYIESLHNSLRLSLACAPRSPRSQEFSSNRELVSESYSSITSIPQRNPC